MEVGMADMDCTLGGRMALAEVALATLASTCT